MGNEANGIVITPAKPKPKRWRKFRLLVICIGLIAIAIVCGQIWNENQNLRQALLISELRAADIYITSKPVPPGWLKPLISYLPKRLIEAFQIDEFRAATSGLKIASETLEKLARLQSLTDVSLHGVIARNEGISALTRARSIRKLSISGTSLSQNDIQTIATLPQLEELTLGNVHLTESDIDILLGMKHVTKVLLVDNAIDLVTGLQLEVIGPGGSTDIKVGDIVTIRGTFQSNKIKPVAVTVSCLPPGHSSKGLYAETSVKDPGNGQFQFSITAKQKVELIGYYSIRLGFQTNGRPQVYFGIEGEKFAVTEAK